MTAKQLAHEFFLGIREAMVCPDVSVAEYEGVMAYRIEKAILAEREACAKLAEGFGSPYYHLGGKEIAAEIRSRGEA